MVDVQKKILQSPGKYTILYASRSYEIRGKRAENQLKLSSKKRRRELQKNRENMRKVTEKGKGVLYQSNCAMEPNFEVINNLVEIKPIYKKNSLVYFDLETTGFGYEAGILQIAAKCDEREFNVCIIPTTEILESVTRVNGCLLYTSPSPRDRTRSRMPSSA